MLNSFTELLLPDNRTNSFIFDSDLNKKPFGQDTFDLSRTTETGRFPISQLFLNCFFVELNVKSMLSFILQIWHILIPSK